MASKPGRFAGDKTFISSPLRANGPFEIGLFSPRYISKNKNMVQEGRCGARLLAVRGCRRGAMAVGR